MPHVITHKCISEVYAACQAVCPADVMYTVAAVPAGYTGAGQPMMVINQDECIDCGACKPECPIDAILGNDGIDPYWSQINKNLGGAYRGQKAAARAKNEPPRRPDNHLR